MDRDKGLLLYQQETIVKFEEPEEEMFQKKKVKQVTTKTGWLGRGSPKEAGKVKSPKKKKQTAIGSLMTDVDNSRLYAEGDYNVDFTNPLASEGQESSEVVELDDFGGPAQLVLDVDDNNDSTLLKNVDTHF